MDLADLAGRSFGPRRLRIGVNEVAEFVEISGDDSTRWGDFAPPAFAAAAMFVVAPEMLALLGDRSVIHGEQTFTWHRPIMAGDPLQVTGAVSRVRERGGIHYIGFEMSAKLIYPVLEGSSLFLIGGQDVAVQKGQERSEPAPTDRGDVAPDQVSASRADLIRYAAATRDWNPIHWDHETAVAAGLPGVVVHGLFQAAWAFAAASRLRPGARPFASARVRFRNPLLPARAVRVGLTEGNPVEVTITDEDIEYLSAKIELADG